MQRPLELGLDDRLGVLAQTSNHRVERARPLPVQERGDLLFEQLAGRLALAPAGGEVLMQDLLQVVDIVDIDPVELGDAGLDVARDRDVDEEDRPASTLAHDGLHQAQIDDRLAGAGAGDDDVGGDQGFVEALPAERSTSDRGRELGRSLGAAVDHADLAGPCPTQVHRGQPGHLAGAEQRDASPLELAKDAAGQVDRDRGDRGPAAGDVGLAADPLGPAKGHGQAAIEDRSDGLALAGDLPGVFDLAEDLRLADDHALEAGRDPEDVPGRALLLAHEAVLADHVGAEPTQIRERLDDPLGSQLLGLDRVDLDPVAGREQHDLAQRGAMDQAGQALGHLGLRERESLAQIDRRGRVIEADGEQVHRGLKSAARRRRGSGTCRRRRSWSARRLCVRAGPRPPARPS